MLRIKISFQTNKDRGCCFYEYFVIMKFSYITLIILLISGLRAYAQTTLEGRIVDGLTGKPIPAASVFLNNSSVGVRTDEEGDFRFRISKPGNYEVVVSSLGYEALFFFIQVDGSKLARHQIQLEPKQQALQEVVIEADPGAGWRRWGKLFTEAFIGSGRNARSCKILNKEVIYFEFDKKKNFLKAFASAPILVENKALGYRIEYTLADFEMDFKNGTQYYAGFPFFSDIKEGRSFVRRREAAYKGSMMHFLRSLYELNLPEDVFSVHHILLEPNREKVRVRQLLRSGTAVQDSSHYYSTVMRQPDTMRYLNTQEIAVDSLVSTDAENNRWLSSPHILQVVFLKGKEEMAYVNRPFGNSRRRRGTPVSELHLRKGTKILIDANGSFFDARDLLASEYWGWSSRMSNMLPLDYQPDE